jgi:hypothetical protein
MLARRNALDLFADSARLAKLTALGDPLEPTAPLIGFERMRALIEALLPRSDGKKGRRPVVLDIV